MPTHAIDRAAALREAAARQGPGLPLAVALIALAGWVDAVAFLRLGLFVSFMSGTSTMLATALGGGQAPRPIHAAILVGLFLAGVIVGELAAAARPRWGAGSVLGIEAALLWLAVAAGHAGWPPWPATLPLVLAMGMQNASVHSVGGVGVSLTYVTGALVHLGQAAAAGLRGADRWAKAGPWAALWLGLIAGAAAGALTADHAPAWALVPPALGASLVALWRLARG